MFESFQVPALSIQNPTTLSLYANGGITGTIVDSGDGVTTTQATWGGIKCGVYQQRGGGCNVNILETGHLCTNLC